MPACVAGHDLHSDNRSVSERRSGYKTSAGGLIGALIAALAVIAFVWGLSRFQHRDVDDPVEEIDFSAQLAEARAAAPFEVLAPRPGTGQLASDQCRLREVWTRILLASSGLLTGSDDSAEYVGVEQSNAAASTFIEESTRADEPGEPVTIDGVAWQQTHQGRRNSTRPRRG